MIRLFVLALLALIGSAAAVAESYEDYRDRINAKLEAHWSCAFDAAMSLVDRDGTPEVLARKAVAMCPHQEKALEWRAGYVRKSTETRLVGIISAERKVPPMFRGKARSRPVADMTPYGPSPHCADCGWLRRQWDDRLQIWRPPGR